MNVVALMLNHLNFELVIAGPATTLIGHNVGQVINQSRIGSARQFVDFSIEQSPKLALRHDPSHLAGAPDQVTRVGPPGDNLPKVYTLPPLTEGPRLGNAHLQLPHTARRALLQPLCPTSIPSAAIRIP
jgi:hypothetical protein